MLETTVLTQYSATGSMSCPLRGIWLANNSAERQVFQISSKSRDFSQAEENKQVSSFELINMPVFQQPVRDIFFYSTPFFQTWIVSTCQ